MLSHSEQVEHNAISTDCEILRKMQGEVFALTGLLEAEFDTFISIYISVALESSFSHHIMLE